MLNPRTAVAVPLTRADPPLDGQVRAAIAGGADLVELRVDLIGDVAAVESLLRGPRPCPYLLTVRPVHEGGAWDGDESDRISLIERLGLLRPGWIDVELAAWRRSANVRQKVGLVCDVSGRETAPAPGSGIRDQPAPVGDGRARNRLILSHHDFRSTPADLDAVFDDLAATPAFAIKAAFAARDASDALRVLDQLRRRSSARRVVALAMGEAGLITRVAAPRFGAFLTFAAAEARDASAPGQPTLEELQRWRWPSLGPATRLYGIVGWPVAHSRSPRVHNAAMAAAGIDGLFVPLPVRPDRDACRAFLDAAAAADWLGLAGLSVTLPHKEHLVDWVRARGGVLDSLSQRCGAANTLIAPDPARGNERPAWHAANTDGPAARQSLAGAMQRPAPWRVTVLGAGGAARAVIAELAAAGHSVTVLNRTPERAARLARDFHCASDAWERRGELAADAVVNCTSVGLGPCANESPFPDHAWGSLRTRSSGVAPVAFDTIYEPRETRFLREARAAGWIAVPGVEMFLAQAARQFELWHGRPPPEGVMRAAFDAD